MYGQGTKGAAHPFLNSQSDSRAFSSFNARLFVNTTGYSDEMFKSTRFSLYEAPRNQKWDLPVTNGRYRINLLFHEMYVGSRNIGDRVFDVVLENETILENFDIVETFGYFNAGVSSFTTEITDQNITIDFNKIARSPMLAGIEVIRLTQATPAETGNNDIGLNENEFGFEGETVSQFNEATNKEQRLNLYPIPASDFVTIDLVDSNHTITAIECTEATTGTIVKTIDELNTISQKVTTNDLERRGIYNHC